MQSQVLVSTGLVLLIIAKYLQPVNPKLIVIVDLEALPMLMLPLCAGIGTLTTALALSVTLYVPFAVIVIVPVGVVPP